MCDYTIEPIAGREVVQRNFARLPDRAAAYSGKRVTLNQRFSVIERGYTLKPADETIKAQFAPVKQVPLVPQLSHCELVQLIKGEEEKRQARIAANNKSQETTPTATPSPTPDDVI